MGLGLLAVLLWSTVATAFKLSLQHLTPLQLLSTASVTSLILLTLIALKQGVIAEAKCTLQQSWPRYLLLGILNPFLYYAVLFQAYDLLPAQQALALNYTWALVMSVLAVPILGQVLHRADIIALLVGYSGVLVIATGGQIGRLAFDSGFGVFLALLSTVIWAFYWIFNTKSSVPAVVGLLLCFCVGTPVTLFVTYLIDGFHFSWQGVLGGVYVGLFEMGITFLVWMIALRKATHTSRVSNLIFLSPFLSLYFVSQWVGEQILPATYVGLVLILIAVGFQQWAALKAKTKES